MYAFSGLSGKTTTMNDIMRDEHAASNNVLATTTSLKGANVMARKYPITLICQQCGTPFLTYEPRKVTCSRACMSARIAAGGAKRRGASNGLFKHGERPGTGETLEHASWRGMRERCSNPNHRAYSYYGGRGVRVCPEWDDPVNGFAAFLAHIGRKPSPEHSIDRYPNYNGNYEPGNVRWATRSEQILNRDPAKPFTHCRRGHPKTPENRAPNGPKSDCCRICRQMTKGRNPK